MKRVLVTGATGFVGSNALPLLTNRFDEVHAVSRKRGGDSEGVRWHRADLLNPTEGASLLAGVRPTHLLHFAWFVEHSAFWTSPENDRWVEASLELVRAFRDAGGERVVAAGTCVEYDPSGGICSETLTRVEPRTAYGVAKDAFHRHLQEMTGNTGLSYSWGRIFFLYGPREHPDRLVASVTRRLLSGERAPTTEGSQVRDFLHVQDVADAFVTLLAGGVTGPVNIASGEPVSVADLVTSVARKLSRLDLLDRGALPTTPGEPPRIVADIRRLSTEVGWRPKYDLDSGLDQAIAWWRSQLAGARL